MTEREAAAIDRWRCFECGAEGIGGAAGWTAHWISQHQDPPF